MQEIKCPKCGEIFQIDESGYAELLKQVRSDEFDREIASMKEKSELEAKALKDQFELEREKMLLEARESERKRTETLEKAAVEAESKYKLDLARITSEKDAEINRLAASIKQNELEAKLKMQEATAERDSARNNGEWTTVVY